VNYFAPGLRELTRKLHRLDCRLRLWWQRRVLARLEGRLGWLGWQQADFDPSTQAHVNRITGFERAQAELTNSSAVIGQALQQLEERRKAEGAAFEKERADRAEARGRLSRPVEESEKALAAIRREQTDLEQRIAALDREAATIEDKYRALLVRETRSPALEAEIREIQQRLIAIPREKRATAEKLADVLSARSRCESELADRRAALSVETEAWSVLEKTHQAGDEALTKDIAARKREKQKIERKIEQLEKAKTQPYREIGRALADQQIEPINQPEALDAVFAQREKIAAREAQLAASAGESAGEDPRRVWLAWGLLLVVGAVGALLVTIARLLVVAL